MLVYDALVTMKLPLALKRELQTMAKGERQTTSEWLREMIAREAERRLIQDTGDEDANER
jgi:predicted transcriptional regulator